MNKRNYKKDIICCLIILACFLSILPLIEISKYNVPAADDYDYSETTYHVWNETHSVVEVTKEAVRTSIRFWSTWQGLYMSAFLLALQPALFGGRYYAVTGIIMLALIIGSTLFFSIYFVHRLFKGKVLEGITIGSVMSFLMLQYMPSCAQGLYWFNGAVNYGFFYAVLLIYICMLIELQRTVSFQKELILFAICLIGAFLLEGGNHITALMGIVFTLGLTVWQCKNKKKTKYNLFILATMFLFLYINLSSPGTEIRYEALKSSYEPIGLPEMVFMAADEGIRNVGAWVGFKEIALLVILSPFFVSITKYIREELQFQFPYPLLVLIASVAWISMMYCPILYAAGHTGYGRLKDVVYYCFVILLFFDTAYIIGWILQFVQKGAAEKIQQFQWGYLVM